MTISLQILWLFVLAIPIACISWTVTHEEVFREPRDFCVDRSKQGRNVAVRKFFYLFTCEYCFSHYVTVFFLFLTDYKLLINDFRGYIIGAFALIWVANVYMSLFGLLRQNIKRDQTEIKVLEKKAEL